MENARMPLGRCTNPPAPRHTDGAASSILAIPSDVMSFLSPHPLSSLLLPPGRASYGPPDHTCKSGLASSVVSGSGRRIQGGGGTQTTPEAEPQTRVKRERERERPGDLILRTPSYVVPSIINNNSVRSIIIIGGKRVCFLLSTWYYGVLYQRLLLGRVHSRLLSTCQPPLLKPRASQEWLLVMSYTVHI